MKSMLPGTWVTLSKPGSASWAPGDRNTGGAGAEKTCCLGRLGFAAHQEQGHLDMLQEGRLPSRAQTGLLSNTWKYIVQGDAHADKVRDFSGKGRPGGKREGVGTLEERSAL